MEWITDPQIWIAFVTLFALEVVLGIDNIIFISILAGKLPADQQPRARTIGLALAMITRILLLFSIAWLAKLTAPLFTLWSYALSGRDLILLLGGLFLIAKSTFEIHDKLEGVEGHKSAKVRASFGAVLVQIALLDIVFSLDSVITAVGMVQQVPVMVAAVVAAIVVMMLFAGAVSSFVDRHPTIKILALSFLILIGTALVAEGMHFHIPKGYVYFAMAFSVGVEMLNLRLRPRSTEPVQLHQRVSESKETANA
ncbi:MAG: TerC family protein [Thermoanaerobaculia bacterium]|nr:TerC family protein [Thermoanaerobaculia bacterium]